MGVSIICINETNSHWKKNYFLQRFTSILKKTWSFNKISFCVSESKLNFHSDIKPGGTAMMVLNPISSAITSTVQDPWGMRRWANFTILGEDLRQTSILNVYRACNTSIETAGINISSFIRITKLKSVFRIIHIRYRKEVNVISKYQYRHIG